MQRNGGTFTLDLVDTDCVSNVYCDVSVYCVFEGESIVSWSIYLSRTMTCHLSKYKKLIKHIGLVSLRIAAQKSFFGLNYGLWI